MSYSLNWRQTDLPYANKQASITVPVGGLVSNQAPITFIGMGVPSRGKVEQENLMRLLENFAGVSTPANPTVGMTWYDADARALKLCTDTAPIAETWKILSGVQVTRVGEASPPNPNVSDMWFEQTSLDAGTLYLYSGKGRYGIVNNKVAKANFNDNVIGNWNANSSVVTVGGMVFNHALQVVRKETLETGNVFAVTGSTMLYLKGTLYTLGRTTALSFGVKFFDSSNNLLGYFRGMSLAANKTWTELAGMIQVPSNATTAQPCIEIDTVSTGIVDPCAITNMYIGTTRADSGFGGWEQVWPRVDNVAGREEYDYVASLVETLVGTSGNYTKDKIFKYLPNFTNMDSLLQARILALNPVADVTNVKASPNSNDWDYLLAVARWLVSKLEMPVGAVEDVSCNPFLQDGFTAPAELLAFPSADVRNAAGSTRSDVARVKNRKLGIISLTSMYTETVNILRAAIKNRFSIKGINGALGTNTAFDAAITTATHGSKVKTVTSDGIATFVLRWNSETELKSYFGGGNAIEISVTHGGTGTANDSNFKTLCDSKGVFRLTYDMTRNFSNTGNILGTTTVGATNVIDTVGASSTTAYSVNLGTGGSVTINVIVSRLVTDSNAVMRVSVQTVNSGVLTANSTITVKTIKDTTQYDAVGLTQNTITANNAFLYVSPSTYVAGADYVGTGGWV